MRQITLAVAAIAAGLILLGRNLHLLPDFYSRVYLDLAGKYWPAVLILFGLQVMTRDKYPRLAQTIKGFILAAVVLWFICHLTATRTEVFY